MKMKLKAVKEEQLVLYAGTAEALMTGNPVSIDQHASLQDAAAIMTDREIGALPVIDDAGQPVGVLSRTDLVRHDRERPNYLPPESESYPESELTLGSGEKLGRGFLVEAVVPTEVKEVMTPTVISIPTDTPAIDVVAKLVALKVHRLFVVDEAGVLVGVISTFDVLRSLRKPETNAR
jgi:CBS domain-containing protein